MSSNLLRVSLARLPDTVLSRLPLCLSVLEILHPFAKLVKVNLARVVLIHNLHHLAELRFGRLSTQYLAITLCKLLLVNRARAVRIEQCECRFRINQEQLRLMVFTQPFNQNQKLVKFYFARLVLVYFENELPNFRF